MNYGSKVGQHRTKCQNIPLWWHIFIESMEMPSVIPSPKAVAFWMSLPVPLRWPSLLPSITATTSERWKGWREWYFKYSIIAGFEDCASLREKPQRPCLCFLCVSLQKKNRAEILFFPFRWCALTGESGVFVSLVSPYIFISICLLMAFHQDVQRAVDRANENVSQPCVPRWARSVSARWKTRRLYRPTLCCAVSDWWLSVVALWLGLQWFITTAHNVIRLYIYTLDKPELATLRDDPNICVFV